ncbi:hypothetical protein GCM10017621_02960 [Maricaulis virginensis]|uniref:Uncharacterized protein n=1 Tax=Maricaulis virginensis TaxID=144022 RepID=A0A9W6MMA8_9PROT|nr:hypothetical protein GCM10017621_02960 [Maricaulis virginensis]
MEERGSNAPGALRRPFDPMLRIGPLPHDVGKKSRNQIEKLVPQPQAAVALGLWILKAAPISSST